MSRDMLKRFYRERVPENFKEFLRKTLIKPIYWMKERNEKKELASFYKRFLKKGDLVFDVGANIGLMSEALVKNGARVVAVEPQKDCIKILKKKFRKNPSVKIINCGVSNKSEEKVLFKRKDADGSASFLNGWTDGTKKEVCYLRTLDDIIKENGIPRYIKLDIEGYEPYALQGLSYDVEMISFEVHPKFIEKVYQCLELLPNRRFNIKEGDRFKLENWVGKEEILEIIKQSDEISLDVFAKNS